MTTFQDIGGLEVMKCEPWQPQLCTFWSFDGAGTLNRYGIKNGLAQSYTYDALNRLTKINYNTGNVSG